ncbi:polymorphic toxin-type HINT domain-containing protein [Amycolatopsis sp. WGS_07]|uniref:polymorphic toxin-type HINT domain-containing protein n=1 Tax=Amycolatopsis sp. WGS_07 TaxID=3076764 RepID=UPI003873B051
MRAGDVVTAKDPVTGVLAAKPVTALINGAGLKNVVDLEVSGTGGQAQLHATSDHPFWVSNQHRWLPAKNLRAGMQLESPHGETPRISSVHPRQIQTQVYNFTVDGLHSYFVNFG